MRRADTTSGQAIDARLRWAAVAALCWLSWNADAQVYKCTDAAGKTSYSDAPCAANVKPYKLPEEPTKGVSTNPRVCDQLRDEKESLAAEADRAVRAGGKETADNAKRRVAMTKQYEARCVAISRSAAKP